MYFFLNCSTHISKPGNSMNISLCITAICLVFILASCDNSSEENEKRRIQASLDSSLKEWGKEAKKNFSYSKSSAEDSTENETKKLESNPFNDYYVQQRVQLHPIACNSSFSFSKSQSIDSILSFMDCVKKRESRIRLLRRVLLLSHYAFARRADSLDYLNNAELLKMFTYIVDQDIPSEAMESNSPRLSELYSRISSLVKQKVSKALVLDYIKDSVFNYFYLSYTFNRPTKNILMLDYNAAGMAGSAEKRYFQKADDEYKEINLDAIIKKVNKAMTIVAKEDATADTDRFEGIFSWNKKKSAYEMQLFIHVRSGAACCPPYIVRLLTKDFNTIEPRSMQFATTEHFSDSTLKPIWKTIQ